MSVFTPLERHELEAFLAPYGLGRLKDFQGISAGTENSNFFVSLDGGEYVLTLIERGPRADLPFFIALLERLHQAGLPVPYAIPTQSGETLRELAEKPALLQPRLAGKHVAQPNAHHCAEIGGWLAHLHLATRDNILERRSDRGLDWMLEEGPMLALELHDEQLPLLRDSLHEVAELKERILALPRANLHADLFRDNALFDGNQLAGVIDFYNACSGPMLYDLAITVNDWCSQADDSLDLPRARALLGAYAALRPFNRAEAELWPAMLRIACLRFWLSRLIAARRFQGRDVLVKDPGEFQRRLAQRQQVSLTLPFAL
ncbi:homoserine kinase [Pseudomonas sp. R-28-1W-6]|jgi:homoserine kinase type II|uniref:homoserine kinase n=1 Tax=Pseudomonas sp. R-28-1W-6 TaxID=2650101 RepID=UPI001365636E|nr:homoserine kinase [Pseudomonas sp. R-28-1W-6]MWV10933.1 homoserine kinase [Pseudomonas sp. R-28-1W-6]